MCEADVCVSRLKAGMPTTPWLVEDNDLKSGGWGPMGSTGSRTSSGRMQGGAGQAQRSSIHENCLATEYDLGKKTGKST